MDSDELAREGLEVVRLAARVVHRPHDALDVEELEGIGHEELVVSLKLYTPDSRPWREFVYTRLRRAMMTALVTARRKEKEVSLDCVLATGDGEQVKPIEETLAPEHIAHLVGVSHRTVVKWIDRGLLPAFKLPGSPHRKVLKSEFARFCAKHGLPVEGVEKWQPPEGQA